MNLRSIAHPGTAKDVALYGASGSWAPALAPALDGESFRLHTSAGQLNMYCSAHAPGRPLLLVHSINAAASAYEVKPLYDHYAKERPVYALELPGFGRSERADRTYTPQLMAHAISAALDEIKSRHQGTTPDAIALSLSSEFLAQVAYERPTDLRAIALVSPTGFDARLSGDGPEGGNRGNATALDIVKVGVWRKALFNALVSKPSMRYFLNKTWGGKNIDQGLFDYSQLAAHQPGAEYAPLSFLTGFLFPTDATLIYSKLVLPVWAGHGIRGDFIDFRRLPEMAIRPNWTTHVFETGAFPHFEKLGEVVAKLNAFFAAQETR